MYSPQRINDIYQEFIEKEVSTLRGSVGGDALRAELSSYADNFRHAFFFIGICRVSRATVSMMPGDVPVVRLRVCGGKKTCTVGPSTWVQDIFFSFGFNHQSFSRVPGFAKRLDAFIRGKVPSEVVLIFEASIQNAKAKVLADENVIAGIHSKLEKKRSLEKHRQLKKVTDLFRVMPEGILTEEDIVRVWREQHVVRGVLES